jgi:cell division protease FtsH
MSAKLGPVKLGQAQASPYLGEFGSSRDYSEGVAVSVDAEVRAIIEQAHDEAYLALTTNRAVLDRLATELLEKETLDHLQVAEIFKDIVKIPPRSQWLSSDDRPISTEPPVAVPSSVRTDGVSAGVPDSSAAPDLPGYSGQQGQHDQTSGGSGSSAASEWAKGGPEATPGQDDTAER